MNALPLKHGKADREGMQGRGGVQVQIAEEDLLGVRSIRHQKREDQREPKKTTDHPRPPSSPSTEMPEAVQEVPGARQESLVPAKAGIRSQDEAYFPYAE